MYIFISFDALEKEASSYIYIRKGIFFLWLALGKIVNYNGVNGLMFQIWVLVVILLPTGHMTLDKVTKSKSQFLSDSK